MPKNLGFEKSELWNRRSLIVLSLFGSGALTDHCSARAIFFFFDSFSKKINKQSALISIIANLTSFIYHGTVSQAETL